MSDRVQPAPSFPLFSFSPGILAQRMAPPTLPMGLPYSVKPLREHPQGHAQRVGLLSYSNSIQVDNED